MLMLSSSSFTSFDELVILEPLVYELDGLDTLVHELVALEPLAHELVD